MKWFGPQGSTPPFDSSDLARSDTPVGTKCAWCDEPITSDDFGFIIGGIGKERQPVWLSYHDECQCRLLIGSLAHLRHECSCFVPGATCTDPEQMSLREGARAARELFLRRHARR